MLVFVEKDIARKDHKTRPMANLGKQADYLNKRMDIKSRTELGGIANKFIMHIFRLISSSFGIYVLTSICNVGSC